jgi:outer membrane immunogenic protein
MRKLLLVSAALAALVGSPALAADMAAPVYKAPPAPAPVWSWTGFYLGVNLGGVWARENFTAADPFNTYGLFGGPFVPASANASNSGVAGGVHGGFNWQVAPSFLLGVEGDFSGTGLKLSATQSPLVSTLTNSNSFATWTNNVRTLSSIRGRVGFIAGDWLFFGTGGWGWGNEKITADSACVTTGVNPCGIGVHAPVSFTTTRDGAVFGAGTEYHWAGTNVIVGVEYLHYQLNGTSAVGTTTNIATGAPISFSAACPAGTACVGYTAASYGINEVRARLSYKF